MTRSVEATVDPRLLVWARKTSGRDIIAAAKRLKVPEATVQAWEAGDKRPTVIQLEKLAWLYKRPLAAFFLPAPPKDIPLPMDFRTIPEDTKAPISPDTRLAVRRARRLISLAKELGKALAREIVPRISAVQLSDDPEELGGITRQELGVDIESQFAWKTSRQALDELRNRIERGGVFVLQFIMPLDEVRAFSLRERGVPVIVLNRRDSTTAKIFSLFHEYCHLLLNKSGMCDMGERFGLSGEKRDIEVFCNHASGAVLVPKNDLLSLELIKPISPESSYISDDVLHSLASLFNVSQEVILRRLLILGRTNHAFYSAKREEWEITRLQMQARRRGGRRNIPRECIQENGIPFVSLVLEGHRAGEITYNDVADFLNVRAKHIPDIEHYVTGSLIPT